MSQSSVKFGKKRVFLVGTINFMIIIGVLAVPTIHDLASQVISAPC